MRHPFFFESEQSRLWSELQEFARNSLPDLLQSGLDDNALTRALVKRMGEAGLLELTVPAGFGGRWDPLSSRALCLARETLGYHSSLADTAFAMQGLGSYPIAMAGTLEQKRQWLPAVSKGSCLAAFAITEPDAGSDVSSISTTATLEGNGYRINGVKRFISNAGIADFYTLFARTSGGPGAGHKGLSAFILPAETLGVRTVPIPLMASHPIGELHLENVFLPQDALLGAEGQGFSLAMQTLDRFRPTVGAAALGMGQRALEEALSYTTSRHQFGQALSEHQATRMRLADMDLDLEAARLLVYQAAWSRDTHPESRASREAAMGKLSATEAAQRVIDSAVQLHGGNGVVQGAVVERLYREVRALRIYEGTSEIQRLVIGGELLKAWKKRA